MPTIITSIDDLQARLEAGTRLVEVLPAKEFDRAHLPEAINIPLTKLNDRTAAVLDKDGPVIVYCYDYQ
jgi:rhodanese-related sulfurtransferase